ncbi:Sorbitol dehydrogenase [Moorella thermoacetica]|uniref:zinc-dependent alcohol dehydrogenase n=1 Tax=Neomoorella thermoacetica TaxID=1525 RepID=UPI0008FA6415|nr:alcohol dehydrogenase catalytic domain-containing protein [Moorella thermoacetica]OIQ10377.1 sorbitol dehydrogenase [Moorella thermoacetica]
MWRANLIKPGQFAEEEVPIPSVEDDQLLINVKVCGICGSDIHAFYGKHPFIKCPIVLGHEFSGVVSAVGTKVKNKWQIGERVIVEPSLICGHCYNCRHGRYNICDELKVIGCQSDGAFAEYIAVPEEKVIPLNDKLSFEEGAMVEPLAVGVHAVNKAQLKAGQVAVIIGAGTIGLMVTQAAKAIGARVIVSDINETKLELAKQLGADNIINSQNAPLSRELKKLIPERADVIFECVGAPATIREAITVAWKGSKIIIVGVVKDEVPIPVGLIQDRELELVGDLMYMKNDFIQSQNMVIEGKVKLEPMINKIFNLKEVGKAFAFIETNREHVTKILLRNY